MQAILNYFLIIFLNTHLNSRVINSFLELISEGGETMSKKFTLIEMVMSIVVLGILLSIVLIKVTDFRKQAIVSTVSSNTKILQSASDMYFLKNEELPIKNKDELTLDTPQFVDIDLLVKEGYLKKELDTSKIKSQYYWIDVFGAVWGSTELPVQSFNILENQDRKHIEFLTNKETEGFNLYEVKGLKSLSSKEAATFNLFANLSLRTDSKRIIRKVDTVEIKSSTEKYVNFALPAENEGKYLVSTIDKYGLESAPFGNLSNKGMKPILRGEGVYTFEIENRKLMLWLDFLTIEETPGDSKIEYRFRVKDDNLEWLDWTDDFYSLPDSKGIQVEITMTGDKDGNYPSLYDLYVKYDYEGNEKPKQPVFVEPKEVKEYCPSMESGNIQKDGTVNSSGNIGKLHSSTYFGIGMNGQNALLPPLPELEVSYKILDTYYWYAAKGGSPVKTTDISEIPEERCVTIIYVVEVPEAKGEKEEDEVVCPPRNAFSHIDSKQGKATIVYGVSLKEGEYAKSINPPSRFAGMNLISTKFYYADIRDAEYILATSLTEIPAGSCMTLVYDYEGTTIPNVLPQPPEVNVCISDDGSDCRVSICETECKPVKDKCTYSCSLGGGAGGDNWCTSNPESCKEPEPVCGSKCYSDPEGIPKPNPEPELWETIREVRFFAYGPASQSTNWYKVETKETIYDNENTRVKYYYAKAGSSSWSNYYEDFSTTGHANRVMALALIQVKIGSTVPIDKEPLVHSVKFYSTDLDFLAEANKPQVTISVSKQNNINREEISTDSILTWSAKAYDPNGFKIVTEEWAGDKRENYPAGKYSVRYRAKNEFGAWSNWVEYKFEVLPEKPIAVIDYKKNGFPSVFQDTDKITWSVAKSIDPDGDGIIKYEWMNAKTSYDVGTHTVKLKVMDAERNWSDWTEITFTVYEKGYLVSTYQAEEATDGKLVHFITNTSAGGCGYPINYKTTLTVNANDVYMKGQTNSCSSNDKFNSKITINFDGNGFVLYGKDAVNAEVYVDGKLLTTITKAGDFVEPIMGLDNKSHVAEISVRGKESSVTVDKFEIYSTKDNVAISSVEQLEIDKNNNETGIKNNLVLPNIGLFTKTIIKTDKNGHAAVTIREGNKIIRTLDSNKFLNGGTNNAHSFIWDGKDNAGTIVDSGIYTIYFSIKGVNGSVTERTAEIIVKNEKPAGRYEAETTGSNVVHSKGSFYGGGCGYGYTVTATLNIQDGAYSDGKQVYIAGNHHGCSKKDVNSYVEFTFKGTGFDLVLNDPKGAEVLLDGVSIGTHTKNGEVLISKRELSDTTHKVRIIAKTNGQNTGIDYLDFY